MQVREIASVLAALHDGGKTVVVAIDGPGGSGKSMLAESLRAALEQLGVSVSVVEGDDFFLPTASRPRGVPSEKPIGGDFDWCRLRDQVLAPLRHGQPARYVRYDWLEDELTEAVEIPANGVVIVEGIYSSRRELAPLYDMRLWAECPRARRLARGLKRDGEAARRRWEEDWMPSEDRYIREHRPHEHADAIVDCGGD